MLVCLDFGDDGYEESIAEIERLAASAGAARSRVVRGKRQRPDARLYAGSGKVEQIAQAAAELNAGFVIFNHDLSPAQQRNLEKEIGQRVLDRTDLILEIFAQRARTSEGKLQGQIESFDQYVVLLKNSVTQMVYKHAISTVVPSRPISLGADKETET